MCAIGRALMARPTLLMLDEPSMGLAPIFVERIFETIVEVNKQGTSILLVEQNALMALDVASRGYVLETGHIALADDAKALAKNEDVRKTYLGEIRSQSMNDAYRSVSVLRCLAPSLCVEIDVADLPGGWISLLRKGPPFTDGGPAHAGQSWA
jgi:ABC-type transporter Mla maintaining outer membrane lipid asymmetry ATPase subunit MlaF